MFAAHPPEKRKRRRFFLEEIKKGDACLVEIRFLFKAVGETLLLFDFVFEQIKPLAEKRIRRAKKDRSFSLDEKFFRDVLKRKGSGFALKDDMVRKKAKRSVEYGKRILR